jgi:putative membrane-bound dehydrogenase-like protein
MFRFRSLLACSLLLAASSAPAAEPSLRAGVATVDISPPTLPAIIAGGFLEKRGDAVIDRLHARCFVLDDGTTKLAFAIVDTCMMTQALIDEAKELASRQCGIPVDHMTVSATHTHSAPAAMGCLGTRLDKGYATFLVPKIAAGIVVAEKNLQPARIGWASIDDWAHTHNRRWIRKAGSEVVDPFGEATGRANMHPGYLSKDVIGPSGPVDPGLSVISIQTRDGKPLGVLANYSQHYFGAGAVSADYYGAFCRQVAQKLGQGGEGNGPFVCAMSQGTSGDLMWMDYGREKSAMTMEGYAEAVAANAVQALREIKYREVVPLGIVERKLALKYRVPDEKRLAWARPIAAQIQNDLPKDRTEVYAREAVILHERQQTSLKLQAIRIGDLTIATLPNEVYAITGLKLKAQSPFAAHFNIELANGAEGYIPTPEQHALGGYTTWPARTAGLEVMAEPKEVEALLGALEEVTGRKRRAMGAEDGPYAKAVLNGKPKAYWRLDDAASRTAANSVAGGAAAKVFDGAAWYLPGAGSGTGYGGGEALKPSAFSGGRQINRALHLAGGRVEAELKTGDKASVALWFWLGHESGASDRSGTVVEALGAKLMARQSADHRVRLSLGESVAKDDLRADGWHFAVLVRDGAEVRLHVDGSTKPSLESAVSEAGPKLAFGRGLEGKLDEIAVFDRVLRPDEIAGFWRISGMAEERARETAARERVLQDAARRAQPPRFAAGYDDAIKALKPSVFWSLREPQGGQSLQGSVKLDPQNFAAFNPGRVHSKHEELAGSWTVSLWFKSDAPNSAEPVTAYLFSRGRNGDKAAPGDHLGIGGTFNPATTGRLFFYNGNATRQTLAGKTVVPPGTWNHAVLVRDGKRIKAFLNGAEQPEFSGEADDTTSGAKDFCIGARSDMFAPLHGYLAQFALFDRALSDAEALALHAASGQPKGTPRVSDLPLPKPKMESQPLSPQESLKKIHVPDGYEIELVAAEPLVLDPVAFDWDERGRLWVVEMADYPLGMDGKGKPGGRVRILEDTDGDGRYDKSTLFADELNFPTGILCWRGGCLVTAAPDVLFLKDTMGTGKSDVPKKLLTGFLEGNQQLRVNGLRWGLDGWVYCANGGHNVNYGKDIAITSTLTGEKIALGSRDFRFKPDTGEFDPLSGPSQFGRNRDAWNHWFGVQNSYPIWHYVLEDRYLRRNPHVAAPSPRNVMTGSNPPVYPLSGEQKRYHSFNQAGHFTSACAATPYLDTLLFGAGDEMHSFTCEPVHDLVQHFIVEDDGVSFKARRAGSESQPDFFASEDRWCRPVMTRTGPDGALWVADMYRYMIEHPQWLPENGKSDFLPFYREGDDKGRIYRIFPKGRRPSPGKPLEKMSVDELLALLESPNGWLRDRAQMLLQARADRAVVPALEKLATGSRQALARAHALSVLENLGALKDETLITALHDGAAGVREHALRLAEKHGDDAVVAAAANLADDPSAKVRLQLALSLGEWKQAIAGGALVKLAGRDRDDPMIRAALVSSLLPHLSVAAPKLQGESALMEPLLRVALAEKRDDIILAISAPVVGAVSLTDENSLRSFRALLQMLRASGVTLERIAAAHAGDSAWTEVAARKSKLVDEMGRLAGDGKKPASFRAFVATVLLADPKEEPAAVALLGPLLAARENAGPFAELVALLAQSKDARVPGFLTQDWDARTPAQREPLLDAMMGREAWAVALLGQVRDGRISVSSFDAQRQARLLKHPSGKVRQLASAAFAGAASTTRAKVLEAYKPALSLQGDPAKGKAVFATACIACHQLDGVGRVLGPDLRSVVGHDAEKLLNSILDPSANIEPGFTAYFCELRNGEQLYGIISGESGGGIALKLADASTRNLLRSDIVKLQSSKASLMPDGLEALLTPQSLADVIAYLKVPK